MNTPVTVVVCAYTDRRWDQLTAAVTMAGRQAGGYGGDVLVVIDHNDALFGAATKEFSQHANVSVITNRRRKGLSGGRNTAIDVARGAVIAFLDDDATPTPGWLTSLLAPFSRAEVVAVGGTAVPVWPTSARRPSTLPLGAATWGDLDWVVGCSYRGQPTTPGPIRNLMGCNMAFRADVLRASGGFGEDLGRVGTLPLGCEETELCIRIGQNRDPDAIWFEPTAGVEHHVSSDRLTWSYLWSRSFSEGVSKSAIAGLVGSQQALATETAYTRRILPGAVVRELRSGHLSGAAAPVVSLFAAGLGYVGTTLRRRGRELRARLSRYPGPAHPADPGSTG